MDNRTKIRRFSVLCPQALFDKIEKARLEDRRTRNDWVCLTLADLFEYWDREKKEKEGNRC